MAELDLLKINNLIKTIVIVFLLAMSSNTYSSNIIIKDIYFDGLQRISANMILSDLPMKIGDLINDDIVANGIKALFATGYFENVKISSDNTGMIVIKVQESPIINNINYFGNKIIKENMIKEILDLKKIQSGQPLNNNINFKTARDLQNIYYSLGKFNATVNIVVVSLVRNRVDLKVMFTEGKTAKIKKINIFGNHVFNKKQLLSKFVLRDSVPWWNLFSNRQYTTQKLLYDLEVLRNFYLNHGYMKFNIDSTQINLTPDKINICFDIYITEGLKYSFSSVIWHGNILYAIPKIKNVININPGELYSSKKIQDIECGIKYILGQYGYIRPSVFIEKNINEDNRTVKLHIYVDAGYRYYVREICLKGNNFTKDSVIRREIGQMEKTQLNCINLLQDKERLKRLNYFSKVDTHIKYLPKFLDQVDVIYQVEERNTGSLTVSAGIGTESGVNVQFGTYQENLLGTGNAISMMSAKNRYQTYIEISILRAYCNLDKMSLEGKIFYNNMNTNYTDLSDYNLKNYSINLNCLYPLMEYHTFNIGLNYVSNHLSKITPQVAIWRYLQSIGIYPLLPFDISYNINFCASDLILVSGWTFNNFNHAIFPTDGSRFNVLSKLTLPGSNNQYYKFTIDGSYYVSFKNNPDWVFMIAAYAGYAGSICKQETPFYDNFYAGGINTIRGFRLNSIGPKAAYYCCNEYDKSYSTCFLKNSQDAIGGNAISFVRTELVIPIMYLDKLYSDVARISIFVDCGTVWDTFWKNTAMTRSAGITDYSIPDNIRVSSGISLKWVSPVGPVIFSYSKVIKKYLGDLEEPFQFSIGKTW